MGMDFTITKLIEPGFSDERVWKEERLLYMRKPYHLADCCYAVALGLDYDAGISEAVSKFGPFPFTEDMMIEVLLLALEIEKTKKVQWCYDGDSRRDEFIQAWEKVIEGMGYGDWVLIEWI